ncbi:MAG: hypothetical protein V7644_1802 [Actinomycetota bacterium]|jgi:hypothetical protein
MRQRIQQLLSAPKSGADAPTLAHLEHTLTDGYALALALDGERLRLERRLGQAAHALAGAEVSGHADDISSVAKRLKHANGELGELRSLLALLQQRARTARSASR